MMACDCGRSVWRSRTKNWLYHDTIDDGEIFLRIGQYCPWCGGRLEEPSEARPEREHVCCPHCGNLPTPAPLGVSADGNWPYVCEQCGKHFLVSADGVRQ